MPYAYSRGDNYQRGDYYGRGDPGILGTLFRGITGAVRGLVTGGPLGAVTGAATALIRRTPYPGQQPQIPQIAPPTFGQAQGLVQTGGIIQIGQQRIGPTSPTQQPVGTMTREGFVPGLCGMKGTRPNKSSYFRAVPGNPGQAVLIPKGSVCVSTRRLNVANPRALRKAIRRIAGFAKLARRSIRWVTPRPPKGRAIAKRRK